MFPNSYSYNPGVVLDPITMTPMIGGGSFTVNPLGVSGKTDHNIAKPEQKVWQKMFIKDIPIECSNDCMLRLLNEFGDVKNYKRTNNQRAELLPFCFFDLETGEEILRLRRLFKNIRMLDKTLELKISNETETFIKEWMAIQKDEWRKKLLAPNMNEAKEYPTIEDYLQRDDPKYRNRIEDRLREVNAEVKKCAIEKMREEEKKEHPREKEREKLKKRELENLSRSFHEQEDYLLKRERNKEKEFRKQKERERSVEKSKIKKFEKELSMSAEEEEKRIEKFMNPERMKAVEREEIEDFEAILEENPPLPEEEIPIEEKRVKAIAGESFNIDGSAKDNNKTDEDIVINIEKERNGEKNIKANKAFENWDAEDEIQQEVQQYELKLPELQEIEYQKEIERNNKKKISELMQFIPNNKAEIWEYPINWDRLSKSVVLERNIRPWLEEQSCEYMGVIEERFIALVEKRLFSRSRPEKVIKTMEQLIEDDSEEFVIKLWKTLILEDLKLSNGIS